MENRYVALPFLLNDPMKRTSENGNVKAFSQQIKGTYVEKKK